MFRKLHTLVHDESGVTALEYAVLAGIVVASLIAAGAILGGSNGTYAMVFNAMWTKVSSATASSS